MQLFLMNKYMLHSGRLHSGFFVGFSLVYAPLWSLFNFSFVYAPFWSLFNFSFIFFGSHPLLLVFLRSFPIIISGFSEVLPHHYFCSLLPRLFHNERLVHLTRAYHSNDVAEVLEFLSGERLFAYVGYHLFGARVLELNFFIGKPPISERMDLNIHRFTSFAGCTLALHDLGSCSIVAVDRCGFRCLW